VTPLLLAAPAAENREASPIALVLILVLLVALIFLVRSMNKHLRRVPTEFPQPETPEDPAAKDG
jgi:type II secretory pathway component PulC